MQHQRQLAAARDLFILIKAEIISFGAWKYCVIPVGLFAAAASYIIHTQLAAVSCTERGTHGSDERGESGNVPTCTLHGLNTEILMTSLGVKESFCLVLGLLFFLVCVCV